MIKKILIVFLISFTFSTQTMAIKKAVFGTDNRKDVYQEPSSFYRELARSTAAMIPSEDLKADLFSLGLRYSISGTPLIDSPVTISFLSSGAVCPEVAFANQMVAARCSGFLVGDDLLVTAGHCVSSQSDCDDFRWVFDYKVNKRSADKVLSKMSVPRSNVYGCKEIIAQNYTSPTPIYPDDFDEEEYYSGYHSYYTPSPIDYDYSVENDYALIRLDRKVKNRQPLKVRSQGEIELGTHVIVIGHPLGLPSKVTTGAHVTMTEYPNTFGANLDAFHGNSGSAVFDAYTGQVEGILVTGGQVWEYDSDRSCYVIDNSPLLSDDKNFLTGITRITNIEELMEIVSQ